MTEAPKSSRLRFFLTAMHTEAQLEEAANILVDVLQGEGIL